MDRKGYWIAFEGVDGVGKTTQVKRLAEALRTKGHNVVEARSPGQTHYGQRIREWLLKQETAQYPVLKPQEEFFLMLADRMLLLESVVRPALERGDVVISDRYIPSTYIYQSVLRGVDHHDIAIFHKYLQIDIPDQYILLHVLDGEYSQLAERITSRKAELTPHDHQTLMRGRVMAEKYLDYTTTASKAGAILSIVPAMDEEEIVASHVIAQLVVHAARFENLREFDRK